MKKVCIVYETGNGRLAGHYTQFAFTGLPGVEIAALADPNEAAEQNFHLTGAKKLYKCYKNMIKTEKPDIVILCSRLVHEHYEQIKFALEHNAHVLCEKPLASDLSEAYELAELAQERGLKVQIAHLARFAPAFRKMKELLDSGEIGTVHGCCMRGKEDHRGGGEDMIVLGTHIMDIAVYLLGVPLSVMADIREQGRNIVHGSLIQTTEPVGPCAGDEIFAFYRFPNGVNGIFESRRNTVAYGNDSRMGITVYGDRGTLSIRYRETRDLRISRNFPAPPEDEKSFEKVEVDAPEKIAGAEAIDYEKWQIDPSKFHFRYFAENNRAAAWDLIQAIDNNREPAAGIKSAVVSIMMIQGAYLSALEQKKIDFPLNASKHPLI